MYIPDVTIKTKKIKAIFSH